MKLLTLALISGALLGGCATINESTCREGNWFVLGHQDARWGYTAQRIESHQQACSKHGIEIDQQRYLLGYNEGLLIYCTASSGYKEGVDGESYHQLCPADLESDFLAGYDLGREIFLLSQEIVSLDKEIDALRREIDEDVASESANETTVRRLRYLSNDRDRRKRDSEALIDRATRNGWDNR